MFGISGGEFFLIILVALIFFGSKNIPDIFKGLGKAYYEFKNATNTIKSEITQSASSIKNEVLEQSNPIAKELYEARKALAEKEIELQKFVEDQAKGIESEVSSTEQAIANSANKEVQISLIETKNTEYINNDNGTIVRTSNRKKPAIELPKVEISEINNSETLETSQDENIN